MKRFSFIVFVVTLLLTASTVFAGGTGEEAPSKSVTFWMQAYGDRAEQVDAMDEIARRFWEETGISLDYEIIDWSNAMNKYSLAMRGGEAPDVAEWFFLSSFAAMGGAEFGPMEINDLAEAVGADERYYPAAILESKIGDDYYALPWRMDVRIMAYRQDFFDAAGIDEVPETWAELVDAAKQLTVRDEHGTITVSGAAYYITRGDFFQSAIATMAQNNTSVIDIAGTYSMINEPPAVEALEFMQSLALEHGVMSANHASATVDTMQEFLAGKIAILLGVNPDAIKMQRAGAPQLDGVVLGARLPSKSGGNSVSSIMYAAPVSIMQSTDDPESAREFLRYFMRDDVQLLISKATGLVNANRNVMRDEFFQDQWYRSLSDQADFALNGDLPVPFWSKISAFPQGPVANAINNILAGADVQEQADAADAEIELIISESE